MAGISFSFMFDGQFQFNFGESDLKNENNVVYPRHCGRKRALICQQTKFDKSHCDEYFSELTFSVVSIVLS